MAGFFQRLFGRQREQTTLTPSDYFAGTEAWTPVSSSDLAAVAYYGQGIAGILAVRFLSDSEYWYHGVPADIYGGLLDAVSKGKYLHQHVKGRYNYKRMK